ncbi:hypothetical protein [Sigmofec virus UA08Rod_6521]|uniref:Uncharacterized protein n=1 Tax=Sigmofec virus UA08Rod_6521 TaxID=2929233 RepID=A0A976N154_9VIRU|nr:hypothetical protein [Sigmofec virus UA08Rod_6521]
MMLYYVYRNDNKLMAITTSYSYADTLVTSTSDGYRSHSVLAVSVPSDSAFLRPKSQPDFSKVMDFFGRRSFLPSKVEVTYA